MVFDTHRRASDSGHGAGSARVQRLRRRLSDLTVATRVALDLCLPRRPLKVVSPRMSSCRARSARVPNGASRWPLLTFRSNNGRSSLEGVRPKRIRHNHCADGSSAPYCALWVPALGDEPRTGVPQLSAHQDCQQRREGRDGGGNSNDPTRHGRADGSFVRGVCVTSKVHVVRAKAREQRCRFLGHDQPPAGVAGGS
jgi:hypothetical protein